MGDFVPLYRQVARHILQKIQRGIYKYGDKIPSEKAMAEYYRVNRMTIRRAVALLAEQGILKSSQGKGIFVTDTFFETQIDQDGALYGEEFFRDPRLRQEILFLKQVHSGKLLGERFQILEEDPLWLLGRLWMADRMAIALEYSYLPVAQIPDLSPKMVESSWSDLFLQHHWPTMRVEQTMRAVQVDGEEAALLQVKEGDSVFVIYQLQMDETRRLQRMTKILAQSQKVVHRLKEPIS